MVQIRVVLLNMVMRRRQSVTSKTTCGSQERLCLHVLLSTDSHFSVQHPIPPSFTPLPKKENVTGALLQSWQTIDQCIYNNDNTKRWKMTCGVIISSHLLHWRPTIHLVIASLLKAYFKTSLSNLLQCFLSKPVWTSLHIQIVHGSSTGANHSCSSSSSITHCEQFTLLLLCLHHIWILDAASMSLTPL